MDYPGRMERARRLLAEKKVDLLAVSPSDDMRYLLGYAPHPDERPCYLLVDQTGAAFVVPSVNAHQASKHVRVPSFAYTDADGPAAALAGAHKALGGRKPGRIAVGDTMRADFVLVLTDAYPAARLSLGSEIVGPLRLRKSGEEIEALRRSSGHADRAMRDAWAACRSGATEQEVADVAAASFRTSGSEEVLATAIASGPNGAFPHHHVTGRALSVGDAITLDLGGQLNGYASDITRMAFIGAPTARYREVHRTVEAAVGAALAAIRPGVPLKDVDLAARGVIDKAGFGRYFTHRVGHGLGVSIHELPSVTHLNTLPIEDGFVFSVEPGIYLPGEFGVRLEEIVYVDRQGPNIVSGLPRDVHLAPAD
jgi:Xaa-Pro aminopeptidase